MNDNRRSGTYLSLNTLNVRWIFRKLEKVVGTGWSWLRIGMDGGHLWVRWGTFGFHKCGEFLDYLQSLLVSFSRGTVLHGVSKKVSKYAIHACISGDLRWLNVTVKDCHWSISPLGSLACRMRWTALKNSQPTHHRTDLVLHGRIFTLVTLYFPNLLNLSV